jgi:hypothetical protein
MTARALPAHNGLMRTLFLLLLAGSAAADPIDIDKAKKDLARIDRELRDNKPAVPEFGDEKPYGREITTIADAYVGTGEDGRAYYEAPDGTVYYMETFKGRTTCSMTGAVSNAAGKGGGATQIKCPAATADWKKY